MSSRLALFGQSPDREDEDAAALGDTAGFAQCVGRPCCVLERVETGYDIEGAVGMRQLFHFGHTEITLWYAPACDCDEWRGGVNASDATNLPCQRLHGQARSTPNIE
jgi:hypothetical protein